jgi:protein ImuB
VFGALYAAEGTDQTALESVAREFSPRIEVCGPREITLDLSGLARLFGEARTIAGELRRTAADRGLQVRVAIAGTRCAARLLVHHRAGVTVIEPGSEAEALAALPLALLGELINPQPPTTNHPPPTTNHQPPTITLRQWGLRTLGEFAALPADEVAARLGLAGVEWQRVARGEDRHPLVAAVPEERFEQTLQLEWPIEELEPLSFVLGRLLEPLSAHLERRDRGAAVLYVRLQLVTRAVHERSLQLPAPMRDARALRTLALLDLESHPRMRPSIGSRSPSIRRRAALCSFHCSRVRSPRRSTSRRWQRVWPR